MNSRQATRGFVVQLICILVFAAIVSAWQGGSWSGGGGGVAFNPAAPGPIGDTTANSIRSTTACVGTSPCTLPAAGQLSVGSVPLLLSSSAGTVSSTNYGINVNTGAGALELNAISGGQVQLDIAGSAKFSVSANGASYANDNIVGSMGRTGWVFDEGPDTSLSANESMGTWFMPKAVTIEKITLDIKTSPTCSVSEQITCFDCGSATGACTAGQTSTLMSAITIASGATRQSIDEAINVATVAANEYISCHITAGTCTVSNNSIQIVTRPQ